MHRLLLISGQPLLVAAVGLSLAVFPARADEPVDAGPPDAVADETANDMALPADQAASAETENDCVAERFVVLTAYALEDAFVAEIRADVAAELAPQGIAVCSSQASAGRAEGTVTLQGSSTGSLRIDVHAQLTERRVSREISLSHIPEAGMALAVAVAIDELLRASWTQFSLAREMLSPPLRSSEPTPQPRDSVAHTEAPATSAGDPPPAPQPSGRGRNNQDDHIQRPGLGLLAGYQASPDNWSAWTLAVSLGLRPAGWGWVDGQLAGLQMRPVSSALGKITARGLGGALALGACTRSASPVSLCGGVRGELWWLQLSGRADAAAAGHRRAGLAAILSATALAQARLSDHFHAIGAFALGGAIRGIEARADSSSPVGLLGLVAHFQLGLGWML